MNHISEVLCYKKSLIVFHHPNLGSIHIESELGRTHAIKDTLETHLGGKMISPGIIYGASRG